MNDGPPDAASTAQDVDVLQAKEVWSEYRLADGTVLRIKPVMITISRIDGEHTIEGDPVYNMKSTLVTDVRAPQELKKSA
ncbi:MAG: hypothetical protein JO139_00580 [Alphaproteobacteria bacterium]|nr:hypothetical protein [Alphaproteobacteria bacterium]MBV8335869.1 hypothetical protein [Alphaproteobacteria bacterium]